MKRQVQRYFQSLRGKGVVMVCIVALVAVAVPSGIGLWQGRALLEAQMLSQLGNIAEIVVDDLDDRLDARFSAIAALSSTISTAKPTGNQGLAEAATQALDVHGSLQPLFNDLLFLDTQGEVVAEYPPRGRIGHSLGSQAFFRHSIGQLASLISAPFLPWPDAGPVIAISSPLFEGQRLAGLVVGLIELKERSFISRVQQMHVGDTGYVVIGTHAGQVVVHRDSSLILQNLPQEGELLPGLLQGMEGERRSQYFGNETALVAFRQFSQVPWFVAVIQPEREALQAIAHYTDSALLAGGLSLLLLMALSGQVIARILRPLAQLEAELDDRMSGVRDDPVQVQGSAEIRAVAMTFNRVFAERRQEEERLSWEATHDHLTGLVNRRAFMAHMVHWLHEVQSGSAQVILAMIDLDHFKPVNDKGGHLMGDEMLKSLAQVFRERVRQTDIVARLGGDEFAIILPGCGLARSQELLEALRVAVESFWLERDGQVYRVTTSIGIAHMATTDASPRQVMSRADEACYAAKAAGRNQVMLFEH